jgi:hypothetical protein
MIMNNHPVMMLDYIFIFLSSTYSIHHIYKTYHIILLFYSVRMRKSQDDADPNDFLVMPSTNRGPSKSNVLTRANQIRAALHSVDNE